MSGNGDPADGDAVGDDSPREYEEEAEKLVGEDEGTGDLAKSVAGYRRMEDGGEEERLDGVEEDEERD